MNQQASFLEGALSSAPESTQQRVTLYELSVTYVLIALLRPSISLFTFLPFERQL